MRFNNAINNELKIKDYDTVQDTYLERDFEA